jgi:hypothetical protein
MTSVPPARDRLWLAALSALCLVLLAPLLVVDMPPLVDYPNHLARILVLASLPDDPVMARFYAAQWAIIPNLALDLAGPPLLRVLPVHDAGRVLIGVAILLPAVGAIAYGTMLGGRWWPLGVALVAYNRTLLEGFLNFNLSVGLALLLAAAWLRWRRHAVITTALVAVGAVALFACHLMGLVLFAILLGAQESVRLLRLPLTCRTLLPAAARLLAIFTVPVLLYGLSPLHGMGGEPVYLDLGGKVAQLTAAFTNYVDTLDVVTACAVLAVPLTALILGRGRLAPPVALAMSVLLAGYLMAPYAWKGTQQIDTRFAIMLGFLLFAGFVPLRWPRWCGIAAAAVLSGLLLFRTSVVATAWTQHRDDLADIRAALAPVHPGQAVFVAMARPDDPAAYQRAGPWSRRLSGGIVTPTHLGALTLIEHRAWWPFAFDNPEQQPIRTLDPYRGMALRIGDLPDQDGLARADLCGFDVVLLLQADGTRLLPDPRLLPLAGQGFARSYAVRDCHAAEP